MNENYLLQTSYTYNLNSRVSLWKYVCDKRNKAEYRQYSDHLSQVTDCIHTWWHFQSWHQQKNYTKNSFLLCCFWRKRKWCPSWAIIKPGGSPGWKADYSCCSTKEHLMCTSAGRLWIGEMSVGVLPGLQFSCRVCDWIDFRRVRPWNIVHFVYTLNARRAIDKDDRPWGKLGE